MDDISYSLEQINLNQNNRNLYYVKFIKFKNVQQIKLFCEFVKKNYELDVNHNIYNDLTLKKKRFLDVIAYLILQIISNNKSFEILHLYYQIVDIYNFIYES